LKGSVHNAGQERESMGRKEVVEPMGTTTATWEKLRTCGIRIDLNREWANDSKKNRQLSWALRENAVRLGGKYAKRLASEKAECGQPGG